MTDSGSSPGRSSMIDWDLAVNVGAKMAGDGPSVSWEEAADVVGELRGGAERSSPLVREYTGLVAQERTAPVLVVDRRGWLQANVDGFGQVISPLIDKLQEKKGPPSAMAQAVGSRVTGAELGFMLGFLSSKVLGQFDPFYDADGATGRLLLVAPNIVQVERELDVDAHDFRLWVCLHEETHRVQFTAVPWMRDHLWSQMRLIVGEIESDPAKVLGDALKKVGDVLSGRAEGSLIEVFSSPAQREVIDRITGVMSLLEGHADVVMDGVGPEVIPSVERIRARFNDRRKGAGALDRLVRRLLGLEQKMAQYRDGAVFVREVVDKVGMSGFNAVWQGPENLPSKTEIHEPAAWLARVHG
ncbi:zinc-dependent metalloprotease [Nocardioides mangrovicus]|nr:zinc-dependent metalloprotease [Nocardioides mangrovicus]